MSDKLRERVVALQSSVSEKLEGGGEQAMEAVHSRMTKLEERVQAAQSTVSEKLKGRAEAAAQRVRDLVPLRARLLVHVVANPAKGAIWVLGIVAGVVIVRAIRCKAKRAREDREAEQLLRHTGSMWESSRAVIEATERHPFLLAMLDGSLPAQKFRYYIEQDAM